MLNLTRLNVRMVLRFDSPFEFILWCEQMVFGISDYKYFEKLKINMQAVTQ